MIEQLKVSEWELQAYFASLEVNVAVEIAEPVVPSDIAMTVRPKAWS